ncbi:MAG: M16 family metallopeptidase [Thermoanaerobaculia bacterium]
MQPPPRLPLERHRLDNGLRIVLQPDRALPLVAVNLWYHVGSRDERPGRTGLAHLFEHMLFQGSGNVGTNDHFRYVQQVGGVANGSTWLDRTNYYETMPAHQLDLALWLESDRMGFLLPALDQAKLERQREVVLNERLQTVDNQPYGRAGELLYELSFPLPHPYHWPVLGYPKDLEATTLEDVESFFRLFYAPDNAVLTLAGDFEPPRALESIERYFGSLPRGPGVEAPAPPAATRAPGELRETMADNVELTRIYHAWNLPAYGRRAWYAADLLAAVLAEGKSSPLYRELVYERQLAQDVGVYVQPTELASMFLLVATARPDVEPDVLEQALDEQVAAAATRPPAGSELERARNHVRVDFLEELQSLDQRADLLSQLTTYFDEPERLYGELDLYLDIGADELRELAAEYLSRENRVALRVVPNGDGS